MKKCLFFLLSITFAVGLYGQRAWTVSSVPNTRLQSNSFHVSDPDGYLTDSAEMVINVALSTIRDSADVFLVTLGSIGDEEPKLFATELFNSWGIGDAGKDNGVLLLFVEDQHALEFETGYGAEAVLTDALCQRIFTQSIVPYFRDGDYEGGLCSGAAAIVDIYGGELPTGLLSYQPVADYSKDSENSFSGADDEFGRFSLFVYLLMIIMPVVGAVYWIMKRKEKTNTAESFKSHDEDGVTYLEDVSTPWSGSPWEGKGCLGALMLGFSLFVFMAIAVTVVSARFPDMNEKYQSNLAAVIAVVLCLTWICFRQGQRMLKAANTLAKKSVNPLRVYRAASEHAANKIAFFMAPWLGWWYKKRLKKLMDESDECRCPTCHAIMQKDKSFSLPKTHVLENQIGALRYRPFRCDNGHFFVMKEKGDKYDSFSTCSKCGAYTLKRTKTETIIEADYSHSGEMKETYTCQNCGHSFTKTIVIPKLVRSSSSSSSSSYSSSRSYSSSSRSSGGSFGGGRSGGGGYSGRW